MSSQTLSYSYAKKWNELFNALALNGTAKNHLILEENLHCEGERPQ